MEHEETISGDEDDFRDAPEKPRQLPDDLPKSLDDRRTVPSYGEETEMYDAWQGVKLLSHNSSDLGSWDHQVDF